MVRSKNGRGRSRVALMGFSLMLLGSGAIAGCQSWATTDPATSPPATTTAVTSKPTTAIASLSHPAGQPTPVAVRGTVGNLVPIVEGTVYELQDETGKVWVLTRQSPPKAGEVVVVVGQVRSKAISVPGHSQDSSIYLEQTPDAPAGAEATPTASPKS